MPDVPPSGSSLDRVMRAHFHDALLIRDAVVAGAPEQAVAPAKVLALLENLDDLPAGWRDFVERMQHDARRIADAPSPEQLAAATADLAVVCGQCHMRFGGPRVSNERLPVAATTLELRMKRHVWAAERLWEGLAAPSGDAWDAGAKALSSDPFPEQISGSGGARARDAATQLARLSAAAPTKTTTEQRAALYADLLLTCGTCHRAIKDARP